MSTISGTCSETLTSQLYQRSFEQHSTSQVEQQQKLQQERLQKANENQPGEGADQGPQDHDTNSNSDSLIGSQLDVRA
jgi:hypothetical protein